VTLLAPAGRPSQRPAGRGLLVAGAIAVVLHLLLLAILAAGPLLRRTADVPDKPDEVAQVQLLIGDGAQQTGTPPPSAEAPQAQVRPEAQAPQQSQPLAAQTPDEMGLSPPQQAQPEPTPPSPSPPAEQAQAPPPTPNPAPPMRPAPPSIRLGDGLAAPPAESPLAFVTAGPDARNTAPEYPPDAARRREQGVVSLELRIDEAGRVVSVEIVQSSGSPRLDEAARRQLATWHFRPAFKDGKPVPSVFPQTIEFTY
jgi:protein TonB